jgi:hypothetical protein
MFGQKIVINFFLDSCNMWSTVKNAGKYENE